MSPKSPRICNDVIGRNDSKLDAVATLAHTTARKHTSEVLFTQVTGGVC
jgi:hypothetical protein